MDLCITGSLALAAFALYCRLGSTETLAQNAYIASGGSDTVSVIDTTTNTVTATYTLGCKNDTRSRV
jgi:YVTN family beta-propeller protein